MGCVLGREVSSGIVQGTQEQKREGQIERNNRNLSTESTDKVQIEADEDKNEVEHGGNVKGEKAVGVGDGRSQGEKRRSKPNPRQGNLPKQKQAEQVAAGWPSWLSAHVGEAIDGWLPRRADTFEKIDKIGSGTYSNVYKARDSISGKIVALKKVRFDNLEPESVRFMCREIIILRKLDHPNVIKLEGLVTSRMSCSLYLVFEYMEHDLAGLAASPDIKFTEEQVKCYMQQLLSGLEHCHSRGVLHRDIKGSNLLIDDGGILRIADFGLATIVDPSNRHLMTSRVVTLWYRSPELLLGATNYGGSIDLWSAGCILAELLAGKPIMPGRNEVEQLHKIFKLCGSPSDEYWKKSKLPNATLFKPRDPYKRSITETFKHFPPSSLPLIETLLSIDPAERGTATDALRSDFFNTEPYACDPSSLPKYPPTKEIDAKRRDDEARRLRAANKTQVDGAKKTRSRGRAVRAVPAPEANAELQSNMDHRRRLITHANAKSRSEKFPPPHQDGALGVPLGSSHRIDPTTIPSDIPFSSTSFNNYPKDMIENWSGPLGEPATAGGSRGRKRPGTKKGINGKNEVKGKESWV
ncbi:probable serine/threonine-protein kinase At1g54610 [Impatiens glandulifera]|uniref:probable serine/threonine-protein kinase At1g54610 n=1 Tax=Impatiens glandulifera TaxID=253017 RepID=UPI001FB088F4|nr:probable serine/threonine-protein kinase At1g54610 [Impatiens glandulifera]